MSDRHFEFWPEHSQQAPRCAERFALQQGMDAIARLGARDARGKVVVIVE